MSFQLAKRIFFLSRHWQRSFCFGIQVGDTVVIRGHGEVLAELDMFQVTADGIYVQQEVVRETS